jgi:hypothetical protein
MKRRRLGIMILQQHILIPKERVSDFRKAIEQRGYKVSTLWKAGEYQEGNRSGPLSWFVAEQLSHSFRFIVKQEKIVRVLCQDDRYLPILLDMLAAFVEMGNYIIRTGDYQEQMRCSYFSREREWVEVPVERISISVPKTICAE